MDVFRQYKCNHCEDKHPYGKIASRYPLLVTSSFLNGWRDPYLREGVYPGDPIHLEELCIPGGKIEDLHRAFLAEYGYVRCPVDVLLAAGLNNFRVEGENEIMRKIGAFKMAVNICHMYLAYGA